MHPTVYYTSKRRSGNISDVRFRYASFLFSFYPEVTFSDTEPSKSVHVSQIKDATFLQKIEEVAKKNS